MQSIRQKLHQELKPSHKEYFESVWAKSLLTSEVLRETVLKVSKQLVFHLSHNFKTSIQSITSRNDLKKDLYSCEKFGRLSHREKWESLSAEEVLSDILNVLNNEQVNLATVM